MNSSRLISQKIKTPDGTILESRHRHDFRTHFDKVSNELYMVDGGLDYARRSLNTVPATEMSVCLEDGIDVVRHELTWGTRGKDGSQPFRLVKLSEMTDDHIQACLDTQPYMHPHYRVAFQMELEYRRTHGITVADV